METVKEFKAGANTYTVKKRTVIEKIDANGGAAPWMIGRKVKEDKFSLWINGDDVCAIAFHNDDKELIEIGKMFGYN